MSLAAKGLEDRIADRTSRALAPAENARAPVACTRISTGCVNCGEGLSGSGGDCFCTTGTSADLSFRCKVFAGTFRCASSAAVAPER